MSKFAELTNAYHTYLNNTKLYHEECGEFLDKFRYTLLAYLGCEQDAIQFRKVNIHNKENHFEELGPQAFPMMEFSGVDGFWHTALVIQIPQEEDPSRKGKVWFQTMVKKPTLRAKHYNVKLNLKPPIEKKIPINDNDGVLHELCEAVYLEAKKFYDKGFQNLLSQSPSTKTIGFQISE